MKPKLRSGLVGGAILGLALVGVVAARRTTRAPEGAKTTAATDGRDARNRSLSPLRCALTPGFRAEFSLHSQTVYGVPKPDAKATDARDTQLLDASILVRALDASSADDGGRSFTLAGVFMRPKVTATDSGGAALEAALVEPVLFRMDESCRVTAFAAPAAMPVAGRNQWKMSLKLLEFAAPAPGTARSWTTTQSDGLGSFFATYARAEAKDGGIELRRSRGGYAELRDDVGHQISAKIMRSSSTAHYAAGAGFLDGAHVDEHVVLKMNSGTLADVETKLTLTALPKGDADAAFFVRAFDVARYAFGPADALDKELPSLPFSDRPAIAGLAGRPLDSVLREVEERLARKPRADFDGSLDLLVQYLRQDPTRAGALLDQLHRGGDKDGSRSILFLALELAGGKEAHAALGAAAADGRLSLQDRLRAVQAFAAVPDPGASTVDALLAMHAERSATADGRELASSASLGLGALAKNPRLDAEDRQRVVSTLGEDLKKAARPDELTVALAAIGNTADPSFKDQVGSLTQSDDPAVEAEAYAALKKMNALPATAVMIDALSRSADPHAQAVLADALSGQRLAEGEIAGCVALLEKQPPTALRASLIQLLGAVAKDSPAAKAALVRQVQLEKEPALLTLLGRYLTPADLL